MNHLIRTSHHDTGVAVMFCGESRERGTGETPVETPTDRSQTPQEPQRSPRPPAEMPRGYFQPYCSCPPHDGPCRTADEEPTRSPRRAMWRGVDQPASQASSEREHLAAQRDRDIEAGVDPVEAIAEYEEATRLLELLDGRIREAVHWAQSPTMDDGTACRYAPPGEHDGSIITWTPTITIDPAQVTCAQCSNRLQSEPERREVNVTDAPVCTRCIVAALESSNEQGNRAVDELAQIVRDGAGADFRKILGWVDDITLRLDRLERKAAKKRGTR